MSEFRRPIAASPKIRGPHLKKIWGQKHAKFRPILHNFRIWSRISPERDKISKIGKICDLEQFLPRSAKKSTICKVVCEFEPTQIDFFGRLYFGLYGVLVPEIFTRARGWSRLDSAHHKPGRGPQKFKSEDLKLNYNFGGSGCNLTKL